MNKQNQKDDLIDDGFSSDEEFREEQIFVDQPKVLEQEHIIKEEIKFKIPPPEEIKSKSYSLNPDMATGWAPKNDLPVPVPLIFEHKRVDCMIRRLWEKKNEKMELCYLGPRFQNTFYAWFETDFSFPYSHIKAPVNMKFTNRVFSGQNPLESDSIIFDSFFESGNLDCAVKVGQRQYDLYIRVDSNTRGHLQWFNFKIRNLQKLQKYKFNICNFQKNKSLYTRGMKPFIYSEKKYLTEKIGWEQTGDSIYYQQKIGKSAKVLNLENSLSYKLSFQYYTEYQGDQIQMAYCVPYTYSQLQSFIKQLEKKTENRDILSVSKLCNSLGGLEVPLLIIHESKQENQANTCSQVAKKCIVISGRAHPGESNGSYMMHGFLEFLCGNSREARSLRSNFIFKIVPMLNPDGVVLGNYRTGISGKDFNRQYRNPQKYIFPEVYAFKKLVSENKAIYRDNLIMFLDFHGHSTKKNVFMYGPEFPIIQRHYYECRVFPKLLSNITNMFRYYSCTFRVSEFKQTTARAVLLRKLMIPFSYTIQASNGSFYDPQQLKDISFDDKIWKEMGKKIGKGLSEYGQLIISSEKNKIQKRRERIKKKEFKKTRGKSSGGYPNNDNFQSNPLTILSSNDDKIQQILSQIKKAEDEKQFKLNEEDQISEGSSDGQQQKDDLSPHRLKFLFDIIKNKKPGGVEKLKKKFQKEQDFKHCKTINEKEDEVLQSSPSKNIKLQKMYQEQFVDNQVIFKPNTNIRGHLLRSKNQSAYPSQPKSSKVAAKIITFSFIGQTKAANDSQKKPNLRCQYNDISPNKKTLKSASLSNNQGESKNKKVLDLSDNSFRQTFNNGILRTNQKGILDKKNSTFYKASPRKIINRLEQYKYTRLFIDEYRV